MAQTPKKTTRSRVSLPKGTRRSGGMVLGTKSRAEKVDRSEKKRAEMYALMAAHPESAEELEAKVVKARPVPLEMGQRPGAAPQRFVKKVPKEAPAKPYIASETVDHPRLAGVQENVSRVINTIEHMRQRKQITAHQYKAAERIWTAHETVYGQTGGVMDMDRARGGGSPGGPPAPPFLLAAEYLSEAKRVLYSRDHRVVVLVACEGRSIDETAEIMYRRTPSRAEKEEIGRCLRTGLRELADRWFGRIKDDDDPRGDNILSHHSEDADPKSKPYVVGIAPIERGKTVHATGHRVFRNK